MNPDDVLSPVEQAEEQLQILLDQTARDAVTIITRDVNPHDLTRGLRLLSRLSEILNDARAAVAAGPPTKHGNVAPGIAGFFPDLMAMLREQVDVLRQQRERHNAARPPIYELESAVRAAEGLGDTALVEAAKAALKKAILEMAEAPVDEGASDPPQPF